MDTIRIKRFPRATTKNELNKVVSEHILDVQHGLELFREMLILAGQKHDNDKIANAEVFYTEFINGFQSTTWWNQHRKTARHHLGLADGIPPDVNLIDVLEYLTDCIMAGFTKRGNVYEIKLSNEILQKAFQNTCELLQKKIVVYSDLHDSIPIVHNSIAIHQNTNYSLQNSYK